MADTNLSQIISATNESGSAYDTNVKNLLTEDNVPGEGLIRYDIRFSAYHKGIELKILINVVEAQKSSDSSKLGYRLENRIVFYPARMISAQKQTEFFHSKNPKTS